MFFFRLLSHVIDTIIWMSNALLSNDLRVTGIK